MIGRLIEDAYFVARFAYFYHKAPSENLKLGFRPLEDITHMPAKNRVHWAFNRAIGK